jgi:hypothetical protein
LKDGLYRSLDGSALDLTTALAIARSIPSDGSATP